MTLSFLLVVLPAGAFTDLANDILVVYARSDILASPERIVAFAVAFAVCIAALQASRWKDLSDLLTITNP